MDKTKPHAPFRQSKLTHILRDSLVGSKTRTCLMANVSPPDDCCQCSLNTLQYASRIRDLSIRHRHRSMTSTNTPVDGDEEASNEESLRRETPKRTFKPATASTPVRRLISSLDQPASHAGGWTLNRILVLTRFFRSEMNNDRSKPLDVNWHIADESLPHNSSPSFIRGFRSDAYHTALRQSDRVHDNRTTSQVQCREKDAEPNLPSSYFPLPQTDIKKVSSIQTRDSKRSYDCLHLMYDDGNERRWKTIPAPTDRFVSGSSDQPTGDRHEETGKWSRDFTEALYSDRDVPRRDQSELFTNRDEILSLVSSRLASTHRRSSSVNSAKRTLLHSPMTHPSSAQKSSKTRSKPRSVQSASTISSSANHKTREMKSASMENRKPKLASSIAPSKFDATLRHGSTRSRHHQRSEPMRAHHRPVSAEKDKARRDPSRWNASSLRDDLQLIYKDAARMSDVQEQSDDKTAKLGQKDNLPLFTPYLTPVPSAPTSPAFVPNTQMQASLDHVKRLCDRAAQPPIATTNDNPWTRPTSFCKSSRTERPSLTSLYV